MKTLEYFHDVFGSTVKFRLGLVIAIVILVIMVPSVGASTLPIWIKGVAGWYSQDKISEKEYMDGIEYLINSGAIKPQIVQDQQAKIKQLEAQVADLSKQTKQVQTYPELRESTKLWVNKQLTDAVYIRQVQDMVDKGILEPFVTYQDPKYPAADKKTIFEEYRTLATSWVNGSYDDGFFIPNLEGLYQAGYLKNPKDVEVAPPEKTEMQVEAEERQTKQATYDASHAKLTDNAKQWIYGYISTETYLENIVKLNQNGDFDPFKTYAEQTRAEEFLVSKAIQGVMKNQMALDGLKQTTQQFIDDKSGVGYLHHMYSVFSLGLN